LIDWRTERVAQTNYSFYQIHVCTHIRREDSIVSTSAMGSCRYHPSHSQIRYRSQAEIKTRSHMHWNHINPFTASCENAMSLSVPGIVRSSHTLVNWNLNNFWSTEPIFNQFFFVFLRTVNALCVCLQYKHPRSIKESSGQTSQSFQSTLSSRIRLRRWA
jgi:hypothetical protein